MKPFGRRESFIDWEGSQSLDTGLCINRYGINQFFQKKNSLVIFHKYISTNILIWLIKYYWGRRFISANILVWLTKYCWRRRLARNLIFTIHDAWYGAHFSSSIGRRSQPILVRAPSEHCTFCRARLVVADRDRWWHAPPANLQYILQLLLGAECKDRASKSIAMTQNSSQCRISRQIYKVSLKNQDHWCSDPIL